MSRVEWHWVERFAAQFALCEVGPDDSVVLLSETASRPELVETSRLALASMGIHVAQIIMDTPANRGPLPIRSTGASQALAGHRGAVAGLAEATFVADCTVEGLVHAAELGDILAAGCRVLMISNEHPENYERLGHDLALPNQVDKAAEMMRAASQMRATSQAGTDLTVDLAGALVAGSYGFVTEPGDIAHWPGGLVLAFPKAGTTNGTVVLAPGDINLTFKEYMRSEVALTIVDDYIVDVGGDGLDSDLFSSYLGAFGEPEAYATSHVGFGMNPAARWDVLPLWDKSQINGTELRAFAGNFLYSTGANESAGRFCRGHFDLPMRNHTVELDGVVVVDDGVLQSNLFA
ncbi:MAG: hypothetical protein V3V01_10320 [Acidimicrobiales bacterium]